MTSPDRTPFPEHIDPNRLTLLLKEAGWRLVGGRRGVYNRFAPPNLVDESGFRGALVVPLDRESPEFNELITAAIREVSNSTPGDTWERLIGPRLTTDAADQFQFRKEVATPAGLIPWKLGEELVRSARQTLAAGARSHVEKMRRFSNRLGQFSNRFLDSVLMGQTAIGSYIVTAYAPTNSNIPIYSSTPVGTGAYSGAVARGRDVTNAVAIALEATAEALEHFHQTASLSGFDFGVERGVSFELSSALHELARDSDGSDIKIAWDESIEFLGFAPPPSHFEFRASDAAVLQRAAIHLSSAIDEVRRKTVVGRVHLLTKKQVGGPGLFGLETVSGQIRKVRVRLRNTEDYHIAVKAHDEDMVLAVNGELERDGSLNWLYDAEILAEVGRLDEISRLSAMPLSQVEGQLSFDDALFSSESESQPSSGFTSTA